MPRAFLRLSKSKAPRYGALSGLKSLQNGRLLSNDISLRRPSICAISNCGKKAEQSFLDEVQVAGAQRGEVCCDHISGYGTNGTWAPMRQEILIDDSCSHTFIKLTRMREPGNDAILEPQRILKPLQIPSCAQLAQSNLGIVNVELIRSYFCSNCTRKCVVEDK